MNKVILIGNLTRDPELTMTANNIALCKFTWRFSGIQTATAQERLTFCPLFAGGVKPRIAEDTFVRAAR